MIGNKPTVANTQNLPSKKKNEIWEEEEIKEIPYSKNDSRPRPEFEVEELFEFDIINNSQF